MEWWKIIGKAAASYFAGLATKGGGIADG